MPITIEQLQQRLPKTVKYEARANALVFKPSFEAVNDNSRLLVSLMEGYEEHLKALTVSLLGEVPSAFHSVFVHSVLPEKFLITMGRQLTFIFDLARREQMTELDELLAEYQQVADDEAPEVPKHEGNLVYTLKDKAVGLEFLLNSFELRNLLITQLTMRLHRFRDKFDQLEDEVMVAQLDTDQGVLAMLSTTQLFELWFTEDEHFGDALTKLIG